MLRTPVSSSIEADRAKNATISSILKKAERYFAIVGDISTFKRYFHCILHVECYARRFWRRKKQTVRKMRQFTRFWRTLSVTSLLLEIFRRIYAISISLYTPSAMYASFIVERSSPVRRMRPFARFWRKLCVISLLLEIFRRLNAILIAFYTSNAMHAVFGV